MIQPFAMNAEMLMSAHWDDTDVIYQVADVLATYLMEG